METAKVRSRTGTMLRHNNSASRCSAHQLQRPTEAGRISRNTAQRAQLMCGTACDVALFYWMKGGFSLSPVCGKTWSPIGEPKVLREQFSRHNQTGLGLITISPKRCKLHFYFTIFSGSAKSEDFIFWFTQLHLLYRGQKLMIVWDGLSAHKSAQDDFVRLHPDWFLFEYFPPYSPELNPVEQC